MTMCFICPLYHYTDAKLATNLECPRCKKTFFRLRSVDLTKVLEPNDLYTQQRQRKVDERNLLPKKEPR